ncbi:MFS general substrate transporter [Glarea lozoyensis ATCC 20868]|uniref:MFS general substrate transporter n=1 Tax=Glarea lozoyensis (strain ATCC 20868 / MF5171) TaxID=1116229 RepID=S3DI54_GLAL2|nr:MFS general substrate transporter [Glarea lozoyensis ATCC 20868]EPE26248.1 MFS general substrate transporter [Glarea lozoyensis ATCC 20868]
MSATDSIEKNAQLHNTNDDAIHNEPQPREASEKGSGDTKSPENQVSVEIEDTDEETYDSFLDGWRLQVLNIGVLLFVCLSFLEMTIVGTSLVSITNSLKGFDIASWVVSAYLITDTGFLMIITKLSDIFGRRSTIIVVLCFFSIISIGCGFSQNMTTLIVLRGFQGMVGGGLFGMAFVVLPEMVPVSKYPLYSALLSSTTALANLMGPLIGGAVNHNPKNKDAWRWIFWLNGPAGTIALIATLIGMPSRFPHQRTPLPDRKQSVLTRNNFRRVDVLGFFFLLGASILVVTALQEGGTRYPWTSPVTLVLLVVGIVFWFFFGFWEWYQSKRKTPQEPVMPWRLATNRYVAGLFLNAFFSGGTFTVTIVNLPQRFQIVNGNSALEAGYRLLTLSLVASMGSLTTGILIQRCRVPPFYVLLGAAPLQMIGLVLMGYLGHDYAINPATYGYQAIAGIGFGGTIATVIMTIPLAAGKQDVAVGMGAIGQLRSLGASIGIAICTNILNRHVSSSLSTIISPEQLHALILSTQTIEQFPPETKALIRRAYSEGFDTQMHVMAGFSAASLLCALLCWERTPRRQIAL